MFTPLMLPPSSGSSPAIRFQLLFIWRKILFAQKLQHSRVRKWLVSVVRTFVSESSGFRFPVYWEWLYMKPHGNIDQKTPAERNTVFSSLP